MNARDGLDLSQLVGKALPIEGDERRSTLPPVVERLVGGATGGGDVEDYHGYLAEKYDRRPRVKAVRDFCLEAELDREL
jgi:hypothetical protein